MKDAQGQQEDPKPAAPPPGAAPPGAAVPPTKPYDGPKAKKGATTTSGPTTVSPNFDAGSVTIGKKTTTDTHEKSEDVDKPDQRDVRDTSATVSTSGVSASTSSSTTKDGKTHKKGTGVSITGNGVSVDSSDTVTEGQGDSAKTTGRKKSVGIGMDGVSYSNKAAGDGSSVSVKAGPDGASGGWSYKDGNASLDIGGGVSLKVVGPTETDDGWVVSASRIVSLKVGGGGEKEDSHGASGSVSASGTSSITRTFAHDDEGKKKATEFATNGAKLTALFARDIDTAKDAMKQMAVGESRGEGTASDASGSASASAGGVTATAGISGGHANDVTITRTSKNEFEVTRTDADTTGKEAGLGATGIGAKYSTSKTHSKSETWVFDLSIPAQARAFEAYVKSGKQPKKGEGAIKEELDSNSESASKGLETAAGGFTDKGTLTETDKVDAQGKKWKEIIGEHELSWSSRITGEKGTTGEQFKAVIDQKSGEAAYGISAKANASDGSVNQEELAQATSTGYQGRDGVAASGAWTVTTYFTESDVEAIVNGVLRGGRAGALPSTSGAAAVLKASLGKAHDTTACARAIAIYVKDTGPKGLAALRDIAGLDTNAGRDEIELAPKGGGPSPFLGPKGREKLQKKLLDYQTRLGTPETRGSIVADLGKDLAELDIKMAELRHDKFPDLPAPLLVEERQRVSDFVRAFESMRASAMAESEEGFGKNYEKLDGTTRGKVDQLFGAVEKCGTQSARCEEKFRFVRRKYYVHIESSESTARSMRSEYAGSYKDLDINYNTAVILYETAASYGRSLEGTSAQIAIDVSEGAAGSTIAAHVAKQTSDTEKLAELYAKTADMFVKVAVALDGLWNKYGSEYKNPPKVPEDI